MDRLQLLEAVNTKGIHTTGALAQHLGVAELEAERALRDAERAGLVVEDQDESINVGREFDRQYWRLSEEGLTEFHRLEDAGRDR